jgi:hypothetical protein
MATPVGVASVHRSTIDWRSCLGGRGSWQTARGRALQETRVACMRIRVRMALPGRSRHDMSRVQMPRPVERNHGLFHPRGIEVS